MSVPKTPLELVDQCVRFADYLQDAVRNDGDRERAVAFADCLASVAAQAGDAITPRPEVTAVPTQEPPLAVRFPAGSDLLAWYRQYAAETGVSTNAALIRGLERHRAAVNDAAAIAREEPAE